MKKIVFVFLIILVVLVFVNNKKNDIILYSWTQEEMEEPLFLEILKEMKVNILYQDFKTDYLNKNDHTLIKEFHDKNIKVYHLSGEKEWAYNFDSIKKEIDKVINYNKSGEKLDGIVLDIEKYLDGVDFFEEQKYLQTMKEAYTYSKNNDIYMVLAIPYWFDSKYGESFIEQIIKYGCDEVSVMNYKINHTLNGISNEIKYSKKHNKKINTIYEIDFNDEEKFGSYKEINNDFKNIQKKYKYKELGIAYHHYRTVKDVYLNSR